MKLPDVFIDEMMLYVFLAFFGILQIIRLKCFFNTSANSSELK